MPRYTIKYKYYGLYDTTYVKEYPSFTDAVLDTARRSFTKCVDTSHGKVIPDEFSISDGKKTAKYDRTKRDQDYIHVTGGTKIPIPYGNGFRIGVTYRDGWIKRPVLSKEIYPTIKSARANAYALVQKIRNDRIQECTRKGDMHGVYSGVGVTIYSVTMFKGRNTDVGSVVWLGDYGPGYMWNPVDCGDAYYVPGVSANGSFNSETYRTT